MQNISYTYFHIKSIIFLPLPTQKHNSQEICLLHIQIPEKVFELILSGSKRNMYLTNFRLVFA